MQSNKEPPYCSKATQFRMQRTGQQVMMASTPMRLSHLALLLCAPQSTGLAFSGTMVSSTCSMVSDEGLFVRCDEVW